VQVHHADDCIRLLWKSLKEIGIDLGRKVPKAVQELAADQFDYVIRSVSVPLLKAATLEAQN